MAGKHSVAQPPDLVSLAEAVQAMRIAQDAWRQHKNRPEMLLHAAKKLEREVDRACEDIAARQFRTPSLFDKTPAGEMASAVAECCGILGKLLAMPADRQPAALKYVAGELASKSKSLTEPQ